MPTLDNKMCGLTWTFVLTIVSVVCSTMTLTPPKRSGRLLHDFCSSRRLVFRWMGNQHRLTLHYFLFYTLLLEIFWCLSMRPEALEANNLNQEWRHTNSLQKMVLFRFGAQGICTYIELVGEEDQKRFFIMLFLIRFIFIFT